MGGIKMICDKTIHTERAFVYRNKFNGNYLELFWLGDFELAHEFNTISDGTICKSKDVIESHFAVIQIFYEDEPKDIVNKREDYELLEIIISYEHTKNEKT